MQTIQETISRSKRVERFLGDVLGDGLHELPNFISGTLVAVDVLEHDGDYEITVLPKELADGISLEEVADHLSQVQGIIPKYRLPEDEYEPLVPTIENLAMPDIAMPELTLGQPKRVAEFEADVATAILDSETVESRCRLKADAAQWARRRIEEAAGSSPEIDSKYRDIISKGKALHCYLWMCQRNFLWPDDLELLENMAGWFEVVADALSLVRLIDADRQSNRIELEESLNLLAEAQSGLRMAIDKLRYSNDDDQVWAYNWLRTATKKHNLFIPKYLRATDTPDSTRSELSARIVAANIRQQEAKANARRRQTLLQTVRQKAAQIEHADDGTQDHWRTLITAVDQLVSGGLSPSNKQLRDLLIPVIKKLPDDQEVSDAFHSVFSEIGKYLAVYPSGDLAVTSSRTEDVQKVEKLLKGKSVVLIGGDRRQTSYRALMDSFGLKELYWLETQKHPSIYSFEAYIRRPDVAVILLAIRWSRHAFVDAKIFCDKYRKPLVWLAAGYNPNQVAEQILKQCSDRLTPKAQTVDKKQIEK